MARRTKTGASAAIIGGYLYYEDVRQMRMDSEGLWDELESEGTSSVRVESLRSTFTVKEWIGSELYEGDLPVEMTLRREKRGTKYHWYAYRRFGGKLYKRYVGTSDQITEERILEVAQKLPRKSNLKASSR